MSLQTAALEYAINHFDNIWAQFTKQLKDNNAEYIAASLKWESDKFTLIQFLENMAELKGYYPYNINYGADTDDLLYNLYNRRGLAIIDAIVKNLTKSPEDLVTPYVALNEMSDISKAYQSIKNTNKDASEPLQDIFDSLNNLIADSPVGQIDNQDAIDKLAQTFTANLTKKA